MVTGVHFLLTYACTWECDHCFVFGSPRAGGTFTLAGLRDAFAQIDALGTATGVYFEGGEPFLYYTLLQEGVRLAREHGLKAGIVSNCYWATADEDAEACLRPFAALGLGDLTISEDQYHGSPADGPAARARAAAAVLGIGAGTISVEEPRVEEGEGAPAVAGDVMFRGRAADKLTAGLPRRPWESFTECPHEELAEPSRVHLDAFGNLHLCQGIAMGNIWEKPLAQIVGEYRPAEHPVAGPLLAGGPAELVRRYGLQVDAGYVDACHLCFAARRLLRDRFPDALRPDNCYGEP